MSNEVRLTSNHYDLNGTGLHMCYNGSYKERQRCEPERISKKLPKFGSFFATQEREVGIASNRRLATLR